MDPELCRRAKEGDADAFASLYETVSSKLYSTAFYMLGRKEDAEDIVMETVTDAFSEIRSLREPAAFEGCIFRILMNKIKRRRKSYIGEDLELQPDLILSDKGDRDEAVALRQALAELPQQDRSILVLDILGGYRSDEIAGMLGMNPNTVRSRKVRALEKLRKMLGEGKNDRR